MHYNIYNRGSRIPFVKLHKDERVTWIIPQPIYQDPNIEYYDMTAPKHGLALIFNNEHFKYHKQRMGSARDEENVRHTCYYLGYRPIVCRQFSRRELIDLLEDLDNLIKHFTDDKDKVDSLLCFFLSHGNEGEIVTSDSRSVKIERIERLVGRSKKLDSKPKIFFIQACRGNEQAERTRMLPESDGGGDGYRALRSDIYIFYASVLGEVAYRYPITGSWFVTEVCHILCKFATCKDVFDLQIELNKRISYNAPANPDTKYRCVDKHGELYAQQPGGAHQLTKRIHFFNVK